MLCNPILFYRTPNPRSRFHYSSRITIRSTATSRTPTTTDRCWPILFGGSAQPRDGANQSLKILKEVACDSQGA